MQIAIRLQRSGTLGAHVRQFAFATALAMNRTLEEGQTAARQGVRSRFTVRAPAFIDRLVKIRREDRATKDRLVARVRVEGPEGELGRGKILTRHEEGGTRTTGTGGYSIDPLFRLRGMFFVPTDQLRPSKSTVIPRAQYPANLRLAPRRDIDGTTLNARVHRTAFGKVQLKGKRRTFVLFAFGAGTPIGIFQRVGPADREGGFGRDRNIVRIWSFRPQITLRPRLQFIPTIRSVVRSRYALNLRGFLAHALRTAR